MTENNAIVPVKSGQIITTMDDAERAAKAMVASGFFGDTKQAAQAIVKILAGQELGFGPFASMTGVHIIQNKPVLAANLMAAAVKRGGKYNYRVKEMTDKACEIAFYEAGQEVGTSRFTWEDAEKAGLVNKDNWRKFPRNMLFARALSNGQKWYAPDVFNGATVYTPDELGATVNDEGQVIDIPAQDVEPESENHEVPAHQPIPQAKPAKPAPATHSGKSAPQAIVDEGLADNIPNAVKILNMMPNEYRNDTTAALVWARLYRDARIAGASVEDALAMATQNYPQ